MSTKPNGLKDLYGWHTTCRWKGHHGRAEAHRPLTELLESAGEAEGHINSEQPSSNR